MGTEQFRWWRGHRRRPPLLELLALFFISSLPLSSSQLVLARPPTFSYTNSHWMESVDVVEGESLSLHCPDIDEKGIELSWRHNDTRIPDANGNEFIQTTTMRDQAGEWRCVARNAAGTVAARPTRVRVLYMDDFDGGDDEMFAVSYAAGSPYVLRRPAIIGAPEQHLHPVYLWHCNDGEVYGNSSHYLTAHGDLVVLEGRARGEERCEVRANVEGLGEIRSRSYAIAPTPGSAPSRNPFSIVYGPVDTEIVLRDDDQSTSSESNTWKFDCVPSLAEARVEWLLDGRPLTEGDAGVRLEKSGRRLVLGREAIRSHGASRPTRRTMSRRADGARAPRKAVLTCKADAGAGRLYDTRDAKLKIIRAPRLSPLPDTLFRLPSDRLQLACTDSAKATTKGAFRWIHNGDEVSRGPSLSLSVTAASYGVYQCEARTAAGVDIVAVWLQEGKAQDSPALVNDGSAVIEGGSEDSEEEPVQGGRKAVFTPHLDQLPDTTTLSAAGIGRKARPTAFASPPLLGPTILRPPADQSVPASSESFHLECTATDGTTIQWRANGAPIIVGSKYALSDGGSRLTVNGVRKADSGSYECEAKNDVGVVKAAATVVVQGGSLLEYGPSNQSILIGMNLELPCQVAEDYRRKAEVAWFVNGERVPAAGDPLLRISVESKGALLIRQAGPDNIGEYRCVVSMGATKEEATAHLTIIEKPHMPRNVRAEVVQTGNKLPQVRISWSPGFDGNSPLLRHVIEMQSILPLSSAVNPQWGEWERIVDNVPAELSSHLLESIRPSSTARFRVLAANRHGLGKASTPSANVTLPQMPPAAAPTKVHATARSSRTVMVQWQRPNSEQWNGDINGYLVRHRLEGYSVPWIVSNITDGHRLNFAVDDLLVWKEYEFQVAAYNERGEGVFSPSVRATTAEGAPSHAPKHVLATVVNATAIRLVFEQPDEQFVNGVNLGYKVHLHDMKEVAEGEFVADPTAPVSREVLVEPDSEELDTVITGLAPWSHATLTVLCFTSAGDGPASQPIKIVTHESVPGAVVDLNVESVIYSEATAIWTRPKDPNGKILKYEVRFWKEGSPASDVKTIVAKPEERNASLHGLTASTKYVVDVRASTAVGDGLREETRFESGVPPELPGRPSALVVSNITSRSVSLSFAPGFDGHSPIRTWYVEAKAPDGSLFHAVFNISAPKARSVLVRGLRPNTPYQLRMIAENIKGRGAPSEASRPFKTSPDIPERPSAKIWAEPLSSTAITLSWTPLMAGQWNGDAIGYLVVYRVARNDTRPGASTSEEMEDGEGRHEVRTRSLRATELTLKDLAPWTSYDIELYAENVVGKSEAAGKILARTYEAAPSVAPSDVRAESRGDRGAIVQWNDVAERGANGAIVGYTVRLVPEESLPPWRRELLTQVVQVSGADARVETFSGLRAATTYKATVAARTMMGDGPASREALVRTKNDVPGKPTRVTFTLVTPNEARLKFFPPDDANGVITQYIVTHVRADDPDPETSKVTSPVPPTMFTFTAMGLSAKSKYIFGVAAENEQGIGPAARVEVWTVPTNETLPLPNPSMPTSDPRQARASDAVAIEWAEEKAPGSAGSSERGYEQPVRGVEVECMKANDANWTLYPVEIAGAERSSGIRGLAPNSAYSFRIRFTGDYSTTSAWSAESEWMKTLPAAPSSAPVNIALAPEEEDALTVLFEAPPRSAWNADAIGFTIYYREYSVNGTETATRNEGWQKAELPEKTEYPKEERIRHTIKGMKGFRHYVVQVRARNSEGSSAPSSPAFAYVGFAVPKINVSGLVVEPLSSTSLAVRWDALPAGGQATGFKVRYSPIVSVLRAEAAHDGLMMVEEAEATITDLLKYTEYQISVSVYNRAGEGQSSAVRISTLEDAPGSVTSLRFSDVLLNSVNVSWSPPTEKNGEITGYIVEWRMVEGASDARQEQAQSTQANFHSVDRLLEGATYHFGVRAETRAGKGPAVEGDVTVGPVKGGPSPPARPELIPNERTVLLEWRDAAVDSRESGPVIGHVVQAKRVGRAENVTKDGSERNRRRRSHGKRPAHTIGDWYTVAVVDGPSPRVELNYADLHPWSYYVFRVYARNARGVGRPSEETKQLFVPEKLPTEMFYTSPWFLVACGLGLLLVLVVCVLVLCLTGRRRGLSKKSPSSHSLQYDGHYPMHVQRGGAGDGKDHRARRPDITRPGTNTSWLSERELYGPPAYGAVGMGGSTGGDSGRGGSPPEGHGGLPNMYGLATDVMPPPAAHLAVDGLMSRSAAGDFGNRLPTGMGMSVSHHSGGAPSSHHSHSVYGTAAVGRGQAPYDADSFDDDFDDEEEDTLRRDERRAGALQEDRGGIASHYAQADKYRDTWRRVRDTEAVPASASNLHPLSFPPSFPAPAAPPHAGGPPSTSSHRTSSHHPGGPDSIESTSETSWSAPSQQAPGLTKGFCSFV